VRSPAAPSKEWVDVLPDSSPNALHGSSEMPSSSAISCSVRPSSRSSPTAVVLSSGDDQSQIHYNFPILIRFRIAIGYGAPFLFARCRPTTHGAGATSLRFVAQNFPGDEDLKLVRHAGLPEGVPCAVLAGNVGKTGPEEDQHGTDYHREHKPPHRGRLQPALPAGFPRDGAENGG
jgi:hypothetical protein